MKRTLSSFIVLLTLIIMAAPVSAQGPGEHSYSFTGLQPQGWYGAASPYLAFVDASTPYLAFNPIGDGTSNTMAFGGRVECANNDPDCLAAGLNGQPLIIFIGSEQWFTTSNWKVEEGESIRMNGPLNATLQIGEQQLGPVNLRSRASLQCANDDCSTLTFQAMACGMAGDSQFGMVMTGGLFGSDGGLGELFASEGGLGTTRWQSLSATAHLTAPGMPNPICGGRSADDVFADEYTPDFDLPDRSDAGSDAFDMPQSGDGRVDRRIVIDVVSVVDHKAEDFTVTVRGHFFGQCGVEPQARSRINEEGIPQILIYRVVPDGVTCEGGLEPFEMGIQINYGGMKQSLDAESGFFIIIINGNWMTIERTE